MSLLFKYHSLNSPFRSDFRQPTHLSMNNCFYKELSLTQVNTNQGPIRGPVKKKEGPKAFSKACEQAVINSSMSGSRVFAQRVAAR